MYKFSLIFILFLFLNQGHSQTFTTETGSVFFIAKTKEQNIEAYNHATQVAISFDTKQIEASLLIKDFDFNNETRKEEFLNKTMEVAAFATAQFTGRFNKINKQDYLITGTLSMHGMESKIKFPAKIDLINKKCLAKATFIIQYTDFEITPPKKIIKSLSKEILVSLDFTLIKTKEAVIEPNPIVITTDSTIQATDSLIIDSTKNEKGEETNVNDNESNDDEEQNNKNVSPSQELTLPKEAE